MRHVYKDLRTVIDGSEQRRFTFLAAGSGYSLEESSQWMTF